MSAALALSCALWAADASAAGPRLELDRVEAEPSWFDGIARVRLFVTAVTLEGSIIPVETDAWILAIGGSTKKPGYLAGHYKDVHSEMIAAIVLETSFEYTDDFESIKKSVDVFLERLPKTAQVAVIDYGEDVQGGRKLMTPGNARKLVERLRADDVPADPKLIEALRRAVKTLEKAKPKTEGAPLRKMIVVVSDGKDVDPTPERYRKIGKRAGKAKIRIHSLAFSPVDNRRPLLGLGEISKRSAGTFRWVRSREGFSAQFKTLADEVERQYVLTYFVPRDAIENKRLEVRYKQLESNELRVDKLLCGNAECKSGQYCSAHECITRNREGGAGVVGWLIYIAVGGGALLVILIFVGFLLSRRERRRKSAADAALAQARVVGDAQAQAGPSNRIVAANYDGSTPGNAAQTQRARPSAAHGRVSPQGPAKAAPAAVASGASVYVVAGPGAGQTLPLVHGFTIGSASNCHLVLGGDAAAAPHHAQIVMDTAGNCTLIDRGSQTGTFVNGVRSQQMKLRHGMLIKIGGCQLRFMSQ